MEADPRKPTRQSDPLIRDWSLDEWVTFLMPGEGFPEKLTLDHALLELEILQIKRVGIRSSNSCH
jgi:hypothetical protein